MVGKVSASILRGQHNGAHTAVNLGFPDRGPYSDYVNVNATLDKECRLLVFWDVAPCGSFKNRRVGGTHRLH
jgi:hypothetical protein